MGGRGAAWPSAEVSKFSDFLNNLKDNYVNNVPGANTDHQQLAGFVHGYAKMALGVWFNSNAVYASGYDYLKLHLSDFIRADGNVTECGRDCHHLQYTLCALTYAAETARIQGNSALYGFNTSAIKQGWTKYEESLEGSTQCLSCKTAADNAVFPGIETAANYYSSSRWPPCATAQAPPACRATRPFWASPPSPTAVSARCGSLPPLMAARRVRGRLGPFLNPYPCSFAFSPCFYVCGWLPRPATPPRPTGSWPKRPNARSGRMCWRKPPGPCSKCPLP